MNPQNEPPLNPCCDEWEEYVKPQFIEGMIFDVCEDIVKKGSRTNHEAFFNLLYEFINDRIEDYYPFKDE